MPDVIHAVGDRGPDDQELALVRQRERLVAQALRAAGVAAGMGEPLERVAGDLVALLDGGGDSERVVRSLQAAAAPAGSYVPPREQFVGLAQAVIEAYSRAGKAPGGSD